MVGARGICLCDRCIDILAHVLDDERMAKGFKRIRGGAKRVRPTWPKDHD